MYIKKGKKTLAWEKDREKLKIEYEEKGITTCELRFDVCWYNNALGFCHKHKRSWYLNHPELLGSFNETILGCNPCHSIIEKDKKLTDEVFRRLRPDNKINT